MNKQDIKKVVQAEFAPFLQAEGYKNGRTPADMIAIMEKDMPDVSYQFTCHVYRYDVYVFDFGFGLGYPMVTDLLQTIHSHTPIRREIVQVPKYVTGISPTLLGDPLNPGKYQPPFGTEAELKQILDGVRSFYTNEFGQFSGSYSDIRTLDRAINSLDNFREKESTQFPPLLYLFVTRLIVARLAENPLYEQVVEKNFEAIEKEWASFDAVFDRTDEKRPEVFAAKYLRDVKL
ncbi:MAG: hypothetical protein DI535_00150 [Citrobacter freundii]|nr:MAG: hypothetical protein DI535_00150 [Citrobacter freundii]